MLAGWRDDAGAYQDPLWLPHNLGRSAQMTWAAQGIGMQTCSMVLHY